MEVGLVTFPGEVPRLLEHVGSEMRCTRRCYQHSLVIFACLLVTQRETQLEMSISLKEVSSELRLETFPYIRLARTCLCCCSVTQSCPTLPPHGLQHARPPLSFTISRSLLKLMNLVTWSKSSCQEIWEMYSLPGYLSAQSKLL